MLLLSRGMMVRRCTARHILTATFILSCFTSVIQATDIAGFTDTFNSLINKELGVKKFQTYLNEKQDMKFAENDVNGQMALDEIETALSEKFYTRIRALEKLQEVVQKAHQTSDGTSRDEISQRCCKSNPIETDTRFRQKVDKKAFCIVGDGLNKGANRFLKDDVLAVMKQNQRLVPGLKWQYFASEQGVLFNYPVVKFCSEDVPYDPRFRPFYVEAATPLPKDVVVIVDKSGSMETMSGTRSLMDIAKEAASTVINTLNPNDRVGIVAFSDSALTPSGNTKTSGCYGNQLAMATPKNIKYLTEGFLVHLKPTGQTYYAKALRTAFSLFSSSPDVKTDKRKRDKVILFLTDGDSTDSRDEILATIRDENKKLQNEVVIFTFGLKNGISKTAKLLLQDMAKQTKNDPQAGEIHVGRYKYVEDANNLRSAMATYYSYFSHSDTTPQPIFSVPYYGFFGLGVLVSICLPVYQQSNFAGVVCVDVTMADILSDVTYFQQGSQSYAFLVDAQSRMLMHPLLPLPQTIKAAPIFLKLNVLEQSMSRNDIEIMMNGTGSSHFQSTLVTSRGRVLLDGVIYERKAATFFWKPVRHTKMTVCVVVADRDKETTIEWTGSKLPSDYFIYHRLDLTTDLSDKKCSYLQRVALKERSVVKFTEEAFLDPYEYQDREETNNDVNSYTRIMHSYDSTSQTTFKKGIRETVQMTYKLDEIFSVKPSYAAWRYIGTENGIFRIIPGHQLPKNFTHKHRPWYQRAIANKLIPVMSTPYLDVSTDSYVVTLSQAILKPPTTGQSVSNNPFGVIGIDFTLAYFHHLIGQKFTRCSEADTRCFVMDSSGFLIVHDDFIGSESKEKVENIHVTMKESTIASDLIKNNILQRSHCVDIENSATRSFWKTVSSVSGAKRETDFYELYAITHSNIYVVIAKGNTAPKNAICNDCGLLSPIFIGPCSSRTCDCPCYKESKMYDFCQDQYAVNSDGHPTCVPHELPLVLDDLLQKDSNDIKRLSKCFQLNCESMKEGECTSTIGCVWCEDKCMEAMDNGDMSCGVPSEHGKKSSGGSNVGLVVGIVLVILVVIIAVVIGVIFYRRHKARPASSIGHDNPAMNRPSPTAPDYHSEPPPVYIDVINGRV